MPAIKIICCECGSENVLRDAWAVWDRENQCWELDNVFDEAFCEDCEGPTRCEQAPLETVTMEAAR